MHAKYELLCMSTAFRTFDGYAKALEVGLDALRLSRSDEMKFREVVPAHMLHLGKLQQRYDFIKFWSVYDPETLWDAPFLHLRGQDMTESITVFENRCQVHHAAALTYIKLTLAQALMDELNAEQVVEQAGEKTIPPPVGDRVKQFLAPHDLPEWPAAREQKIKLQGELLLHAKKAFKLTHEKNKFFWEMMMDIYEVGGKDFAPYQPGDTGELVAFLTDNADLWDENQTAKAFVLEQLREL